jgi:hypothetical protein
MASGRSRFAPGGWGRDFVDPTIIALHNFETPQILFENPVLPDAIAQALDLQLQRFRARFGQPVDHPLLMALGRDQAASPQVSQMFGNGDLRQVEDGLEMTDAKRALRQQVQNAQARLIAQAAVNFNQFHLCPLWYMPYKVYTSKINS